MLMFLAHLALAADPALATAGIPIVPDARFALALYCNPTCSDDALAELDTALATIESTDDFSDHVATPQRIMGIGGVDFGIPDADFVAAYGVDVDRPEALAASQMVVLAWFAGPREKSIETFAVAHAAFAASARATGGWVEDLDTQLLFGADAWASRDPRGPLSDWFVVEEEPGEGGGNGRLITRGLRRYGDFELVVEDVPPAKVSDVGWALDAIAATLHPLSEVPPELAVDTESAVGTARFEVATPREGEDPKSPVLRARFSGTVKVASAGPSIAAEAPVEPAPLSSAPLLNGGPPPPPSGVVGPGFTPPGAAPLNEVPPPRNMAEAQAAVRARLATLAAEWSAGLPAGAVIAVSAPFDARGGGKEYLWVEVTRWQEGSLSGRVSTQPYDVPGLRKGDSVNLRESEVFDFVYKRADGTKEGNFTKPFRTP